MPTEQQIEEMRARFRDELQNATITFGNRTMRSVDGGISWTTLDSNGFRVEDISINKEIAKEEVKEEKKEIEGVDFVIDADGRKVSLPIAILQEEYIYSKQETGNEVEVEEYVNLKLIEQANENFNFYSYYDEEEDEFYQDEEYEDLQYFGLRSSVYEHPHLHSNDYLQMYLSAFKVKKENEQNINYHIRLDVYKKLKKYLEYVGVQIIADDKEREIEVMEEGNVNYIYQDKPNKEELEKMLNLVDLDTFCKLIKARLCSDGTIDKISEFDKESAKNYLERWAISKYKYYKMFGDKLTIEAEVEVEKEEREFDIFRETLKDKFPLYRFVFGKISTNAIAQDTIKTKSAHYISSEFFEDLKVKNNMSLTKFLSLYGNKELDIEVSKFYQEKGKAHLVISIDPVDYLTVSINKSGWRSCHHFLNGEYKNAGLSYMNDSTSLVSYRSNGEEEYSFEGKKIKWNSKSWRQMIYVSEESSAMVFSRQYPYNNDKLTFHIRQMMEECVSNFFKGSNKWTVYRKPNNTRVSVDYGNGATLYNDVYNGFDYQVVRAKDDEARDVYCHIPIGSKVYGVFSEKEINRAHDDIW